MSRGSVFTETSIGFTASTTCRPFHLSMAADPYSAQVRGFMPTVLDAKPRSTHPVVGSDLPSRPTTTCHHASSRLRYARRSFFAGILAPHRCMGANLGSSQQKMGVGRWEAEIEQVHRCAASALSICRSIMHISTACSVKWRNEDCKARPVRNQSESSECECTYIQVVVSRAQ